MCNHLEQFIRLTIIAGFIVIAQGAAKASAASLEQGIAEYRSENFEEAIETLSQVRRENRNSSIAAFYLGLAAKQTGNYREAVRQFQDALRLSAPVQDAYPEIIEALSILGHMDDAEKWVAEAEAKGSHAAHVAFLKGLIRSKRNDPDGAAAAFARAKTLDPSLSQAADLQSAMVHARQYRLDKALENIRAVIAVNPTSELASFAREYEKSLAAAREESRPLHLTLGVGYQYDDNVVARPSSDIPGVGITGGADSALLGSLRLDYRPHLGDTFLLSAQYNLLSTTYGDHSSHNTIIQALSLVPGLNLGSATLSLPASYTHVLLHQKQYMEMYSLRPTLSLLVSPDNICQVSAGIIRRGMLQSSLAQDEDRNGLVTVAGAGYMHTFADGKGMMSFKYEFTDDDTEGVNWQNRGNRVNMNILYPVSKQVSVTLSGDIFAQNYKDANTAFNVHRDDWIYSGAAGVNWQFARNLGMNAQYVYTRADSTIPVYDYRRNILSIGMEFSY